MSKSIVFYADDDEDDREFVAEAFQLYDNIELKLFTDGMDFLSHIDKDSHPLPCLVILDINMPKIDGKDALRLMRQKEGYEKIPAVLFTTSTLPADTYFARHYNAGFITKPLDLRQMTSIVEQFLDFCSEDEKIKFRKI